MVGMRRFSVSLRCHPERLIYVARQTARWNLLEVFSSFVPRRACRIVSTLLLAD
jgi:hypothetical protein